MKTSSIYVTIKVMMYFIIENLHCFQFCRKFDACALRGRPDQNKHCGSGHPFVSTEKRKCQAFSVPMVVVIKE